MLEHLRKLNPEIALYGIDSPEFAEYGRVLDLNVDEILKVAAGVPNPESGSSYAASLPEFEALPIAKEMQDLLFGTLPSETGYCWGANSLLNGAEWHTSSEINIAVTPLVLILGKRSDLVNNHLDSSVMKAFLVPQGAAIEVYATSLHFCPCQVQKEGFGCVVVLPAGTNVPLDAPTSDPYLFRKNKWLIAHEDNAGLIGRGVVPGISGTNYEIKY